ncbi:RhuM family protein [Absicoccus porci]|uniref:RhuM family protein n=1 Tax=Absicoccus porci TaxID=2486576 RepID=UPI003D8EE616
MEGNRKITRKVDFYNLDAIIAVGYRVNSKKSNIICSEPRKLDKMKFNRRVHFFYEIDRKTEKRNLSKT